PHLVGPLAAFRELDEEVRIDPEITAGFGVELDQPALDAVGVELRVPAGVQRVGQVDALAVAADLDHLRAAVDRTCGRVGALADDAADANAAGLDRVAGIGHVIPLQLAGAPARHVQIAVV